VPCCLQYVEYHIKPLQKPYHELYLKTQFVSRSKHSVSVTKTNHLMPYSKIITVCSQTSTKHINAQCGQNVEFVNVKAGGLYNDH